MIAIEARHDDVILAGSLWQPTGTPRALLVMHPGSGPSDRDNDVLFPPIREVLLANGIAVSSFDKRGVGESTGSWLEADILTQATDLAASVAAVQDQLPGVPTGLFGHSQGGWVVLEAANRIAVEFVVTNSGPGVSPRVQEEYSTGNQLRGHDASDQRTPDAAALFATIMDWLSEGVPFGTADARLREPDRAAALEVLIDAGAFVPQDEALWNFAATIIDYDPASALRQLRVPLLALFGGDDTVVPVDASAERFRASCPDELLTLLVFPGGDHRIQTAGEAFVAGYLDAIVDFILSTVG
jgi:pimeloyl-ACP methyl ester carboxylesterase